MKSKLSPSDKEWIKAHRTSSIQQLQIAVEKPKYLIIDHLRELEGLKPLKRAKKNKMSKIGKRKDLDNTFMRSGWEANVARLFKHKKTEWLYEPKTFWYTDFKTGTVNYTPDFYLPKKDQWVEVKGMLRPGDKTRIRRFKKFFPDEFKKLVVIVGSKKTKTAEFFDSMGVPVLVYYREADKQYREKIKHWE